jgi:hypothetical protein
MGERTKEERASMMDGLQVEDMYVDDGGVVT